MKRILSVLIVLSLPLFSLLNAQTALLEGSVFTNNNEISIRSGGEFLQITLSGDIWVLGLGEDNDSTISLLSSISGTGSWSAVTALLDYTAVTRVSDTEVRLDLPATSDYNIYEDETISVSIDASVLETSIANLAAGNDLIINHDVITASATGDILLSLNESEIRQNPYSLIITVVNDTLSMDVGEDNITTSAILNNITGNQNWATIAAALDFTNVTRTSNTVVTINIPLVNDYYIEADELISISLPSAALQNGNYDLNSLASFSILNEAVTLSLSGTLIDLPVETEMDIRNGGASLVLTLTGDEWLDNIASDAVSADILFGAFLGGPVWTAEVTTLLSTSDLFLDNSKQLRIELPAVSNYNINDSENLSVLVPASILKHSSVGNITAVPNFSVLPMAATISVGGSIFDGSENAESDIRNGGSDIILQLTEGLWEPLLGTADNAPTTALISSFTGNGDWAEVSASLSFSNINLTNDSTVVIDLPVVLSYDIFEEENISILVGAAAVQNTNVDISGGSLNIEHDSLVAVIEGSLLLSKTESQIRAGGDSIVIKLRNDIWASLIGQDNGISNDLISSFSGDQNWNLVGLDYTNVFRKNDSTLSVIIPESVDYYIGANENLSIVVPASTSANISYSVAANPVVQIVNEGVSMLIGGDVIIAPTEIESDIRTGGSTLQISLIGDQWVNNIDVLQSNVDLLSAGITGSASWNTFISTLTPTDISQDNENTITITLPLASSYEIETEDFISVTIGQDLLKTTSSGSILINNAFSIIPLDASLTTTGTIITEGDNQEDSIRSGESTIEFILTEDNWNVALGSNNSINDSLINGISGGSDWETKIKPAILGIDHGETNIELSGAVLSITLPAVADYNISLNDSIKIDIPAICFENMSAGKVSSSPEIIIVPAEPSLSTNDPGLDEINLDGIILTLSLKDEVFLDNVLDASNFTTNFPLNIGISSVIFNSSVSADIMLTLNEDFDVDLNNFSIQIGASELAMNNALISDNLFVKARLEPVINSVTISSDVYGIGEIVPVVINVQDDQDSIYTLAAGTIAGQTPDSLIRQNNTSYIAYFTVFEGQLSYSAGDDIPVSDLRLDNLPLTGDVHSSVVNNMTVIDAQRPIINYMQVSGNSKKIGDQIEIIISADGNSYLIDLLSTVNSVAVDQDGISFSNLGNGVYLLDYTIREGDDDVVSGDLNISLGLTDIAGNSSGFFTALNINSISIDATLPLINQITVGDEMYSIDDTLEIVVSADGDTYNFSAGTEVNEVPLSSLNIWELKTGINEYTLYYKVRSFDSEVEPGNLKVKVVMTDLAGNVSSVFQTVEPNSLAIYTNLPTATILGNEEICEDDSVKLLVNLSGRFPLKFYSSDGTNSQLHDGILSSPYEFYVSPSLSSSYQIDSVIDYNGIKNSGSGNATVIVNAKTFVEFVGLSSSYSLEDDPVLLEANFMGGTFSGPGVISTTGSFNPGIADTLDSPHTLYYEYINENSCHSVDSFVVFVLGAQGDIFISQDVYCDYDIDFEVQASNTAGDIGKFRLLNDRNNEVIGLIDNLDNTAIVSPLELLAGKYTIEYTYQDGGAFLVLREVFNIESVQTPKILTLSKTVFCQNESPLQLKGDIEMASFSGIPGVTGDIDNGFYFNPRLAKIGENTITYTNTSANGCHSSVSENVLVNLVPEVLFQAVDSCIDMTDPTYFENITEDAYTVSEWGWNFGDINSGEDNYSSAFDGFHTYTRAGNRTIQLIAKTIEGCADTLIQTIDFGDKPLGSFIWTNECYLEGDSIMFVSKATSDNLLTGFNWSFYESDQDSVIKTGNDTVYYEFKEIDDYKVKLEVETEIGCTNYFTREIVLKPTIRVADEGNYFENFELSNGRWSSQKQNNSEYNSWKHDFADFSKISENNSNAWYTDVPEAVVTEQSWIISPCFNLENLEKPIILFDFFRNLEDNEGVVIQSSVDNEETWQNVGTYEQGINWFNDFQIANKPAGQEIGWSGSQSDEEWHTAIRYIDKLKDIKNVRFRLHYGTIHQLGLDRKGFAFDNFKITSRSRLLLMESFTSGMSNDVTASDSKINQIYRDSYSDVVKLEYHTDYLGSDPFNKLNVFVPATRSLFYGINKVPHLIIDGGKEGLTDYDNSAEILSLDDNDILLQSLYEPGFEIDLDVDYEDNSLVANIELTALDTLKADERILHVVIFEKKIEGVNMENGQTSFLNVVKDMIPNAAGTAYFKAWNKGESVSEQFQWTYLDVYDPSMLRVAVFVQNDNTKDVYQAATDDTTNLSTAINPVLYDALNIDVFPNPSSDYVYLRMNGPGDNNLKIELLDVMGRLVMLDEWQREMPVHKINTNELIPGIYNLRLLDEKGIIRLVSKLVIVR